MWIESSDMEHNIRDIIIESVEKAGKYGNTLTSIDVFIRICKVDEARKFVSRMDRSDEELKVYLKEAEESGEFVVKSSDINLSALNHTVHVSTELKHVIEACAGIMSAANCKLTMEIFFYSALIYDGSLVNEIIGKRLSHGAMSAAKGKVRALKIRGRRASDNCQGSSTDTNHVFMDTDETGEAVESFNSTEDRNIGTSEESIRKVTRSCQKHSYAEPSLLSKMKNTSKVGIDLTKEAADGKLDIVVGRQREIAKAFEVLARRRKSNPCLIGESGVGKTAIVEGMAQMIASNTAPARFNGHTIISIDISAIVAGTKYRGDFEKRFNDIIAEIKAEKNIIVFFDEVHQLIGSGASDHDGAPSGADILKPSLARGEICVIGATTVKEYRTYIEPDDAFARRMETIMVREPSVDDCIKIVEGSLSSYSKHHNINIHKDVIRAAVELSERYIPNRKLPDKAISLIDDAASAISVRQEFTFGTDAERKELSVSDIRESLSRSTGIDVRALESSSREELTTLKSRIEQRLVGQQEAIDTVVKAIRRNKSGVRDPKRPVGTFLFVGPTGVGKTELCKVLAEEYNGNSKSLIRIDMSEYSDKFTVSKLIGSPPGYIGYMDGGQLTEAVKRMPYAIVLLDEIEKAHEDIYNILLQVLDDGRLTDSHGDTVDFKNTIIIMTSNVGHQMFNGSKKSLGFTQSDAKGESSEERSSIVKEAETTKELEKCFRPEFLNRIDNVVVFNKLTEKDLGTIVNIRMHAVRKELSKASIELTWDQDVVKLIASQGKSDTYGARQIHRQVQSTVEDMVSDEIIDASVSSGDCINLTASGEGVRLKVVPRGQNVADQQISEYTNKKEESTV